jgi:hypothetical protein
MRPGRLGRVWIPCQRCAGRGMSKRQKRYHGPMGAAGWHRGRAGAATGWPVRSLAPYTLYNRRMTGGRNYLASATRPRRARLSLSSAASADRLAAPISQLPRRRRFRASRKRACQQAEVAAAKGRRGFWAEELGAPSNRRLAALRLLRLQAGRLAYSAGARVMTACSVNSMLYHDDLSMTAVHESAHGVVGLELGCDLIEISLQPPLTTFAASRRTRRSPNGASARWPAARPKG